MDKVFTHNYNKNQSIANIKTWNIPNKEKISVSKFVEDYETGKITRRVSTNTSALIVKTLSYLKFGLQHIKKENPSKKDLEIFFDNLIKDKYRGFNQKTNKYNGLPYSIRSKKAILEMLSRYYLWKYPKDLNLVSPLKIELKTKAKEPPSLTLDEIDKLYNACKRPKERYFIAVLFSSGSRAEEFHNIRYSDIAMPKGKDMYVKIRIRSEFSKTEGRTIELCYKHTLEAVKQYLTLRINEGIKPEEPVFKGNYNTMRNFLDELGKKTLGKRLNYHLFRHSCATWMASKSNRQQLCNYFGWKFSSNMPDVYIRRSGIDMQEVTEKFKATEFEELKLQNERMQNEIKEIRELWLKIEQKSNHKPLPHK